MNTTAPVPMRTRSERDGELVVTLDYLSMRLLRPMPIEIRNESMALVKRIEPDHPVELAEGLYQISAVLHDGLEYRRIANVKASARSEVQLAPDESGRAFASSLDEPPSIPVTTRPRIKSDGLPSAAESSAPREPGRGVTRRQADLHGEDYLAFNVPSYFTVNETTRITLDRLQSAAIVSVGETEWTLRGSDLHQGVASASVSVDGVLWRISLPLSSEHEQCLLRIDPRLSSTPVTAWIAPDRTTASALQNMLLKGEYSALVPLAERATDLLRHKYDDPTGASLGALILHKVGRLAPYTDWLENLARDFSWIPDSKVFLASLLVDDREDLYRALELAIDAATTQMLFSETLSILLDMLRRWPYPEMTEPHRTLIEDLARDCVYVSSTSLFLCRPLVTL
jgi:hypothetical protein